MKKILIFIKQKDIIKTNFKHFNREPLFFGEKKKEKKIYSEKKFKFQPNHV